MYLRTGTKIESFEAKNIKSPVLLYLYILYRGRNMNDNISKSQKKIIIYLGSFRFLNTIQFQKLFNHKDSRRVRAWLKDLKEKRYIGTNFSRRTYQDSNRPAIYYLLTKSIKILEKEKNLKNKELRWIYKEKNRKEKFINFCVSVADIYLFFLSRKKKDDNLNFFTKTDLSKYDYFPESLPEAYIAIKNKRITKRFFLNVFDPYTPPFVLRNKIAQYINYSQENKWEDNTSTKLPSVLFVCSNSNMVKHIDHYARAKFAKEYEDKLSLYLTTQNSIKFGAENGNVWQKVK